MGVDSHALVRWYRECRTRSRRIFDAVVPDAYYRRPIDLRHPIVFYEGHLAAFAFNTLVKRALGGAPIDPRLETLFARGIDPEVARAAGGGPEEGWPTRAEVAAFVGEAERRVLDALGTAELDRPGDPLLHRGQAAFAILEHEVMHQETLLYMLHRLPLDQKVRPSGYAPALEGRVPADEWIEVPAGWATLGVDADAVPFAWDNEAPAHGAHVRAFSVQRHDVTNAAFLDFVEAGGYEQQRWWTPEDWDWLRAERIGSPRFWEGGPGAWRWRGMFELLPLPLSWPVYVSQAEASAFARWRGARLMSEAEYQRAAYGSPEGAERAHPWGDAEPTAAHGVFDFASWDPEPAGSRPAGASAWGVEDLVGNGWEWTATQFGPFPGFAPLPSYPEYSADFFDGAHYVMKGASPATARELLRPTFRNWFRSRYPYVYATFRCARSGG
jgi:gamma-glutamyl hercynylcysteine S-oxide synthase